MWWKKKQKWKSLWPNWMGHTSIVASSLLNWLTFYISVYSDRKYLTVTLHLRTHEFLAKVLSRKTIRENDNFLFWSWILRYTYLPHHWKIHQANQEKEQAHHFLQFEGKNPKFSEELQLLYTEMSKVNQFRMLQYSCVPFSCAQ